MAETAVRVEGLKEFRRELRNIDKSLAAQLSKGHKRIATLVADDAKAKAQSAFGVHRSQARGIAPRATQTKGRIALNTGRTPRLLAAEFGAAKHWVPAGRTGRVLPKRAATMRRRVFPPWSGNQWVPGEGPTAGVGYAVHPTIRSWVQSGRLAEAYWPNIMAAMADAFPEGSNQ